MKLRIVEHKGFDQKKYFVERKYWIGWLVILYDIGYQTKKEAVSAAYNYKTPIVKNVVQYL